jgi:hypothetical protein
MKKQHFITFCTGPAVMIRDRAGFARRTAEGGCPHINHKPVPAYALRGGDPALFTCGLWNWGVGRRFCIDQGDWKGQAEGQAATFFNSHTVRAL